MAQANVARRQGDDFQARIFWLNAASLLDPASPVIRVAYEFGPKAFDDILIEYDPAQAPRDHEGAPIRIEHVQCKWHTRAGTFGYQDLVEPAFINASRHSLLQRVHQAQVTYAPAGNGLRFELKTNWRIRCGDPLLDLIGKSNDAIDINQLFSGKTDRSRMGKVRKLWRDHLGINDSALQKTVHAFAIAETPESLMTLRQRLDDRFAVVGLKRVSPSCSAFLYDDLIVKLMAQGCVSFDQNSFREMARREGIFTDSAEVEDVPWIGVRSFMHPIDRLENRCRRILDLVPYFDGRYIQTEADWKGRVSPELRTFLLDTARSRDRLRLVLDTHVSLAFAAGALLNVKSGKRVEIEQRTGGRRFWSMDDNELDPTWPRFIFEDETIPGGGNEIAVATSLTHNVSPGVRNFVRGRLPRVGWILHARIEGEPSQKSVHCGQHAWQLAESVVRHVLAVRSQGHRASPVHVFVAGPNGFAFFLGQQLAIGPTCVYEWDFEGQRDGGYSLGLSVAG